MATYTPNYNLAKPEMTDPTENFLSDFGANMDIIDQNLGGGGGSGNVDDVQVNGVSVLDPQTHVAEITSYKEVTQAQYDDLPSSKLTDGIAYFIKDGGGGSGSGGSFLLMITAETGLTVTATKDGTTLTATEVSTGVYEVEVTSAGTWTLSDGTNTETVDVGIYTATLSSVPEGSTVLPTDDIQIWLACARINDKSYTTLAEVLADTTTLLALINSPNAVDYMVRSTTWAKGASVPAMTSDTTPSGVCSASSVYSGYPAWYAFDDNFSYYWNSANAGTSDYIQYEFPQKVRVDRFKIIIENNSVAGFHNLTLSCGDTESDLVNHGNFTLEASTDLQTFEINADLNAKIFRLTSQAESDKYGCVRLLNFYSIGITDNSTAMSYIGLNNYCANTLLADSTWCESICNSEYFESVLNVKVPKMTGTTTPSGEVLFSTEDSTARAWKAFDEITASDNRWTSLALPAYIGYDFTEPVSIVFVTMVNRSATAVKSPKNVELQTSEDKSTWNTTQSYVNTNNAVSATTKYIAPNSTKARYHRWYITSANDNATNNNIAELQFYGRKDI